MASTRSTISAAAVAALILTMNFVFLATPSEACGSKCCPCPKSPTPSSPAPSESGTSGKCPVDTLKLSVCADVLGGLTNLLNLGAGSQRSEKTCCSLVAGLADLDAAVCLCTVVKANVLGIVDLKLPVQLSLLVNHCGKKVPAGFQCT